MNLDDLKKYAKESVTKWPHYGKEIAEIVELAVEEVESGASEHNEVELAMDDIYELIN